MAIDTLAEVKRLCRLKADNSVPGKPRTAFKRLLRECGPVWHQVRMQADGFAIHYNDEGWYLVDALDGNKYLYKRIYSQLNKQ